MSNEQWKRPDKVVNYKLTTKAGRDWQPYHMYQSPTDSRYRREKANQNVFRKAKQAPSNQEPPKENTSLIIYFAPFIVVIVSVSLGIIFCMLGAVQRGYEIGYVIKSGGVAWVMLMALFALNAMGRELYAYISGCLWIIIILGLLTYGILLMNNAPLPRIEIVY